VAGVIPPAGETASVRPCPPILRDTGDSFSGRVLERAWRVALSRTRPRPRSFAARGMTPATSAWTSANANNARSARCSKRSRARRSRHTPTSHVGAMDCVAAASTVRRTGKWRA